MDILEEAVRNSKIIPLQVDAGKCGFGHFYNSLIIHDDEIKKLWESIDRYHNELHDAGEQALLAIRDGDMEKANNYYQIAKQSSQMVYKIIDEIINVLNNRNA